MDLTDNEKRDLIRLIENNQPIPENYRFKLFKNEDEIELLWNGKSYDITNVSLPFQIIEHVDEPREEKKIQFYNASFCKNYSRHHGSRRCLFCNVITRAVFNQVY